MRADKIVVMEQGRIAEVGTPKELLEKEGILCSTLESAKQLFLIVSLSKHSVTKELEFRDNC